MKRLTAIITCTIVGVFALVTLAVSPDALEIRAEFGQQHAFGGVPGGGFIPPTKLGISNVFTSTLKGLVPASGGGTSNFLRADGTWATPSGGGGGGGALPLVAGYTHVPGTNTGGSNAQIANMLRVAMWIVPNPITVDSISIQIGSGIVGSTTRLLIYSNDSATNRPGVLFLDAGTYNTAASGTKTISGLAQAIPAGIYWLGLISANTATVRTSQDFNPILFYPSLAHADTTISIQALTYGGLNPASPPATLVGTDPDIPVVNQMFVPRFIVGIASAP